MAAYGGGCGGVDTEDAAMYGFCEDTSVYNRGGGARDVGAYDRSFMDDFDWWVSSPAVI
jgi:hypothetical protein